MILDLFCNCNELRVTFNNVRYLYLIPTSSELSLYKDELWWSNNDLKLFMLNAINEIKILKNKHPFIQKKDILKLLYQPNNISYDENNFI